MDLKDKVKEWMSNNDIGGDNPWFDPNNTYYNLTKNQIIAVSKYLNSCERKNEGGESFDLIRSEAKMMSTCNNFVNDQLELNEQYKKIYMKGVEFVLSKLSNSL